MSCIAFRRAERLSVVIPTLGRETVLVETIGHLLRQQPAPAEILVVDQTVRHGEDVQAMLEQWHEAGAIRWIHQAVPGVVTAMNRGLAEANGQIVLFIDDDIVPSQNLLQAHCDAHSGHPDAWAVAMQVLQPGQVPGPQAWGSDGQGLQDDLEFPFHSSRGGWISNVMAGNLSVKREHAVSIGGFDENFIPPVAYRFETEFARRLIGAGGRIWFEPSASVRHLRAPSGGTRSIGSHLSSPSPLHGVGDYYYALRCGKGWERFWYMFRRPFREVRTKFHLRHPWYVPVKFVGELRAAMLAMHLFRRGPQLMTPPRGLPGMQLTGQADRACPIAM